MAELTWARAWEEGPEASATRSGPEDVLSPGDVVLVEPVTENAKGERPKPYPRAPTACARSRRSTAGWWRSTPIPAASWPWPAASPTSAASSTGRPRPQRQPGSAFKPFVYLAALEQGYTPATLVLDAPFVLDQGAGAGQVEAGQLHPQVLRPDADAHRHREVAQPDDRAPGPDDRHGTDRRD